MADLKGLELRIQATKKQVQESKKQTENPALGLKLRQARKRLRRLQRKRRALLAAQQRLAKKAEPRKQEAGEKTAGDQPTG